MTYLHISWSGPERSITDAKGKHWTFEMHHYCGPIVLNKSLDPIPTQPGEKSPFWHAVSRWAQDGERLDDKGECVWGEEPQPILEHMGGKHYRVVGYAVKK